MRPGGSANATGRTEMTETFSCEILEEEPRMYRVAESFIERVNALAALVGEE